MTVLRKLDQRFEEADQQRRIDFQMQLNAEREVDHRPIDSLPWADQTVIAIKVLGLPRILQ
jgi:hypothetical protein